MLSDASSVTGPSKVPGLGRGSVPDVEDLRVTVIVWGPTVLKAVGQMKGEGLVVPSSHTALRQMSPNRLLVVA